MHRNKICRNSNLKNMKGMQFKMEFTVVVLYILFESAKKMFFVFRMVLISSMDYQHECTSGCNYILMNIRFE